MCFRRKRIQLSPTNIQPLNRMCSDFLNHLKHSITNNNFNTLLYIVIVNRIFRYIELLGFGKYGSITVGEQLTSLHIKFLSQKNIPLDCTVNRKRSESQSVSIYTNLIGAEPSALSKFTV